MRYVRYAPLTKHEAVEPLCSAIVDAVEAPLDHSDSLVYEFLPNLEVSLSGTPDKMPWTAYWEKITEIAKELKEAKESGDYHPDAVIGITNGGAAFADFLMQQIGYDCPVISLWNNRGSDRHFNSELNKATVLGLKRHINKRSEDEIRILVVDDIVGRAKTVRQASSFYYASY